MPALPAGRVRHAWRLRPDAWSRIHSVPNVVVADSSAFTTGPEKNPVLTAMAPSARASDRLARDLRAGVV